MSDRYTKSGRAGLWTFKRKPANENPDLTARVFVDAAGDAEKASGDGPEAGAHQADAVEIGLFAGVLFGALAGLIALV